MKHEGEGQDSGLLGAGLGAMADAAAAAAVKREDRSGVNGSNGSGSTDSQDGLLDDSGLPVFSDTLSPTR